MKKIKIIGTPSGAAPLEIREQWVEVELPLSPQDNPRFSEFLPEGSDHRGGYVVEVDDAVRALRDAGKPEAALFWLDRVDTGPLIFGMKFCERVVE